MTNKFPPPPGTQGSYRPSSRSEKFRGRVTNVGVETVKLPNGVVAELEIIQHPGGSAVVAINAELEVCLIYQYRHAAGGWLWELPAGKRDNEEPPLETAKRELAEEAGCEARNWRHLGSYVSSPGVFTEIVHLFLAQDLLNVPASPGLEEVFEIHWIPLSQAVAWVHRTPAHSSGPDSPGESITDAKTALGLMRVAPMLSGSGVA